MERGPTSVAHLELRIRRSRAALGRVQASLLRSIAPRIGFVPGVSLWSGYGLYILFESLVYAYGAYTV